MTRQVRSVRIDRVILRGLDPRAKGTQPLRHSVAKKLEAQLISTHGKRPASDLAGGPMTAEATQKIASALRARLEAL